jgi:hypothetical protein
METGVTSDPVPAVVGTSTRGRRGPFAFPTPQASSRFSPEPRRRAVSLAISREDPPPKPHMPVALISRAISTLSIKVFRDGSASTRSNTHIVAPASTNESIAGSHSPSDRIPGSVTTRTRGPSLWPAIVARRAVAPSLKTMLAVVLNMNGSNSDLCIR